jgi:lysophospholipase L1-like esterase
MRLLATALVFALPLSAAAQPPAERLAPPPTAAAPVPPALTGPVTYTCGPASGTNVLNSASLYSATAAGFDLHSDAVVMHGDCFSTSPIFFSIPVPEGNYRITVALGGKSASVITVRAEARRLMLQQISIKPNETVTRTFDVNVRVPEFIKPDGTPGRVRLKQREVGNLDWDNKLTLEFNGGNPSFHSITIQPITEPTIYLAGDSTMVDQDVEPWASWGQMLPRFLSPGVVVANHAESGESSSSFVGEQRMAKIMSLIKPGDFFFVQFAHNDQKLGPAFPEKYRGLMTDFVNQVRAKGATPIIVTAMVRDQWGPDGKMTESLAPYPQISREVAAATHTPLIDLNAMSRTMFEAMGKDGAGNAYMHFPANTFPDQAKAIDDNTHFNNFGAYEIARIITHGIRADKLPLVKFLDPTVPDFNPAHPDNFADFALPYTPMQKAEDTTAIPQANLK